ncbi:MAG: hypothetical protein AB7G47_19295 [Mycolicibacterium sp.]|uniref:hypothetical protein n=1 Tax=Mycolicibacterium sp. TaxID=2320850 RepID=UPI003D110AA1
MSANAQEPATATNAPAAAITRPEAHTPGSGPGSAQDGAAPVLAVVAAGATPGRYRINDAAFETWCEERAEDLESELPGRLDEQPAGRLSSFADDAVNAGIVEPVSGLQLDVYGDDSYDVSGFYVMVSNIAGPQQHLFLTSGWNELYWLAEGTDPREAARDYLETICTLANTVIDGLYPQRVVGAGAANIVTIELSDGGCATWLLTDQRADAAAAAITVTCGPPDSQLC